MANFSWKGVKLRVLEGGVAEPDLMSPPVTGAFEARNVDEALKKGAEEGERVADYTVRSVSHGPEGILVYLVPAPAKKDKPKPRRRATK